MYGPAEECPMNAFSDRRVDLPDTNMFRYMRDDVARISQGWSVIVDFRTASEIETERNAAKAKSGS